MPDLSQETGAQEPGVVLSGRAAGVVAMIRPVALLAVAVGAGVLAADLSGLAVVPPAQAQPAATTQEKPEETTKPAGYRLGDLTVGDVWAHQSTNRDGAAYLRIGNAGTAADALIDASTPFAKRVELRGPLPGGDAWKTGRVDAVPVPAGKETVLDAAALYLRLVGLRDILSVGEKVRITLTFEQAGAITVEARVLSPNEAAAIIEKAMPQTTPPEPPPQPKGAPGAEPARPAGSQ